MTDDKLQEMLDDIAAELERRRARSTKKDRVTDLPRPGREQLADAFRVRSGRVTDWEVPSHEVTEWIDT